MNEAVFNSIDPFPFRNKNLHREAEEFIVGWAKDLPRDTALALVVDLDRGLVCRTRQPFCAMRSTSSWPLKDRLDGNAVISARGDRVAFEWSTVRFIKRHGTPWRQRCLAKKSAQAVSRMYRP
jgi:hypothetical protein